MKQRKLVVVAPNDWANSENEVAFVSDTGFEPTLSYIIVENADIGTDTEITLFNKLKPYRKATGDKYYEQTFGFKGTNGCKVFTVRPSISLDKLNGERCDENTILVNREVFERLYTMKREDIL